MNSQEAKRAVVGSTFAIGLLVGVRDLSTGQLPSVKFALGVAFTSVSLSLLAQVAPGIAGPLALLVLVAVVMSVGSDAFSAITKGL